MRRHVDAAKRPLLREESVQTIMKGRQKETLRIRHANKAVATGRLMLGQVHDWLDFLKAETDELENLPRRVLKTANYDIKKNVSTEIRKFCETNFVGMTEAKLADLYNHIKSYRGLDMPLREFEEKYARVRPRSDAGKSFAQHRPYFALGVAVRIPRKIHY